MLSGTSRDGIDAVLVNFSHDSMDILHALCTPYPPAIKLKLDQLLETGAAPTRAVAELLDEHLAYFFARVAQNLVSETGLEMRDIRAIGSHGQNVWHQPIGENPVSIHCTSPSGRSNRVSASNRVRSLVTSAQRAWHRHHICTMNFCSMVCTVTHALSHYLKQIRLVKNSYLSSS